MGWTSYCSDTRALRASAASYDAVYTSAGFDKVFTQQKERRVHDEMKSQGVAFRECRDSEAHPEALPIVLALDVTGSMGNIPRQLVAEGLPTLMSTLIQRGIPDAALCFLAIGDHECDRYPVQIAQFESGDAELDMWLTRTYIEGGGGGNAGESYPLAWEFAANRVRSDAWEKRKQKGFLITIGDEPFLKSFPASAMRQIYGDASSAQDTLTAQELFDAASKVFNVIHISVDHGYRTPDPAWTQLLGQNHIITKDHNEIPSIIANAIIKALKPTKKAGKQSTPKQKTESEAPATSDEETVML